MVIASLQHGDGPLKQPLIHIYSNVQWYWSTTVVFGWILSFLSTLMRFSIHLYDVRAYQKSFSFHNALENTAPSRRTKTCQYISVHHSLNIECQEKTLIPRGTYAIHHDCETSISWWKHIGWPRRSSLPSPFRSWKFHVPTPRSHGI